MKPIVAVETKLELWTGGIAMAKTKLEVVSVFDGTQDATDVFVSLIADKIMCVKQQDILANSEYPWYTENGVPKAIPLASGLCG